MSKDYEVISKYEIKISFETLIKPQDYVVNGIYSRTSEYECTVTEYYYRAAYKVLHLRVSGTDKEKVIDCMQAIEKLLRKEGVIV